MNDIITQDDLYAARIFFNSALPLLKVVATDCEKIGKKFLGKKVVFQVSALYNKAEQGKLATYIVIDNGNFDIHVSQIHPNPDIEFIFPNLKKFIIFFSGKGMPLPKMKGVIKHFGAFLAIMGALLKMAGLLQAKDPPKDLTDQILLVKLYFYLLPNGISQLNKQGHSLVTKFTANSPDRAYAWAVTGYDELSSYLRICQGNSKAGRGKYPRCTPFLTMRFDTPYHALEILMSKADMIDYIAKQFLIVEGAPEFASTLGEMLLTVGAYAQGTYF
ncbi:MAG: hypothetical protein RR248_02110 [Clostridia bacterium]